MIELIPNQQFIFEEIDNCCAGDNGYCQKAAVNDDLFIQFKQVACDDDVICNSDFLNDELVPDGDFEYNPVESGDWVLETGMSGSWIYDSVNKYIHHLNGAARSAICAINLTGGSVYFLEFDVEFLIPHVSQSLIPYVGGTAGTTITLDGHYGMYVTAGVDDEIKFTANQYADCSLDNVSLREVSGCWDFDTDDIQVSVNGACHISDTEAIMTQVTGLVKGVLYKVVLTLSNMKVGYVTVTMGTTVSKRITANGEQIVYVVSDGNNLIITMSAEYDGCVTDINAYPMRSDFQFTLKDTESILVADLNPSENNTEIEIGENEFVTLRATAGTIEDLNGNIDGVGYGCYKICIYDPCKSSLGVYAGYGLSFDQWVGVNPDIINSYLGYRGWLMVTQSNGDGTAVMQLTNVSLPPLINWTNSVMQMIVQVDFTTGAIVDATNRVYINLPNNQKILMATNVVSNTVYKFHVVIDVDNTPGATYQNTIRLICEFDGTVAARENEIRSVIVTAIPMENQSDYFKANDVEMCSNCLNYSESFDCSRMLIGNSSEDYSLGFYFGGIFKLKNRLKIFMVAPIYPQEEDDYLFSDGVRALSYAQSEKYLLVKVAGDNGGVDEATHDNINAILISDSVLIDSKEYFIKKGEYKPDWDRLGESRLAESDFYAKRKNQAIFNRNV